MAHGVEIWLEHMLSDQNIYYSGSHEDLDSVFFVCP